MDREILVNKYTVDHLTMGEIASELGVSRQAVHYWIRKYGIKSSDGERVEFKCDECGKTAIVTRKRFRKSIKHFCSFECYKSYLGNSEYRQSRTGQRMARLVVEGMLGRSLRCGEVVHHIDGNNMNNDIGNLVLFKNNSDHIAHHHKMRQDGKLS